VSDHLLDYVPSFPSTSNQKRVSGPCPWCGGEDRFVVFVDEGEGKGAYKCFDNPGRGCGKSGDAIKFLREYHDLDWVEACEKLGFEEKLEKYGGQTEEDRRIENEKRAPNAALQVKKWNIVRSRVAAIKRERKRRKAKLRRKRERERRRKVIENMNDHERWLLSEVKVYRRTRRLHRAVARFVTLHARDPEYEGIGSALTLTERPLEVLNDPKRFEHVEELYKAFRRGLARGMPKAPKIDDEKTEQRTKKLLKLAYEAQQERASA